MLAHEVDWDQLSYWLYQSTDFQSTQQGLRFTQRMGHIQTAANAVLQGLAIGSIINEALPFYCGMITAPRQIDYVVNVANGELT